MESNPILPFPLASSDRHARDLDEIEAAIAMVVGGVATRVRLVGLGAATEAAAQGLARAQRAGVGFALHHPAASPATILIGPVEARA